MKQMLSKAYDWKQSTQNFSSKHWKIILKKEDFLTVFEPKHLLGRCYDGTDAIPLSQTATFNITCLKMGFKEQSHMFGLSIFSTKI